MNRSPLPPETAPPSGFGAVDSWREESWFAALGLAPQDTDAALGADASADSPGQAPPSPSPATSRTGETAEAADALGALPRVYRTFSVARAVLGAAMVLVQALLNASLPTQGSLLVQTICAAYAVAAFCSAHVSRSARGTLSPQGTLRRRWFVATVGVDLAVFGVLMLLIGPQLNVAALFGLPVLMAASLTGRRTALAVAAVATLALLGGASVQAASGEMATVFMQAGLTGAGLFAIAALTSELAVRLAREERAARSTLSLARQQALLNRLVIEEMQDGVLVVDRAGQLRAANPAALALIGARARPRQGWLSLQQRRDWQPLLQAVQQAYAAGTWPDGGRDIHLRLDPAQAGVVPAAPLEERSLRLRMRFARRREREIGEALCVLFLDDVHTLRDRARQEQLAAMGRVSAGIAHEIRNPLAAIAQANALLAEDLVDAGQRRLAVIVADNVERLRRIVEDVMAAAPGGSAESVGAIDLAAHADAVCQEWLRTNGLPELTALAERPEAPLAPLSLQLPAVPLPVRFDPEHLRRVLINLLDNAWRHGSQRAGSVSVRVEALPGTARLSVASDGERIAPEVERHLFEPFFSTRSRGSGLGLYICRELCTRYGASIDYRAASEPARHGNVFDVRVPAWPAPGSPLAAPELHL